MTDNAIAHEQSSGRSVDAVDPTTAKRNNLAIIILLISVFVVFLNETVMSVAVPDIMEDLRITPSSGQWLTTAFALTMAVVIPITGFLLQRLNTRPVFITAMVLFSAGTLIAATSPTFGVLVLGRVVQASGTAIMMPLLMTTVLTLVPMSDRGRMMGRISIVMSMAPALGPAVSGLILQVLPWRFLFWLVLPIAIAALIVGIAKIPNVSEPRKVPLDVLSVILSAIGFSGLVFGLSQLGATAEGTALLPAWIPLVIGVVFLVGFVLRQLQLQRGDRAFLDLRVFSSRTFTKSVLILATSMIALFGTVIVFPLYVQNVLGQETSIVGLLQLPGGLIMGLLGPVVGRLYDRFGARPLLIPGSLMVSLAFWGMTMFTEDTPVYWVLIAHIGLSLGLAFLFTTVFTLGTSALPRHLYSHGSAMIATIQQVAGAAGVAVFVAFLAFGTAAAGASDAQSASPSQLADGVHLAFIAGAIVSLVPLVIAFFTDTPKGVEVTDDELEHSGALGH